MNFIKRYKANIIVWLLVLISVSSFFIYKDGDKFDETIFDVDNIYDHIEELTSEKYLGKMAGTEGNELALKYVEDFFIENGIEPAGEDGTYYQTFSTILPDVDTNPIFTINDLNDEPIIEFKMYEDYTIAPYFNGSGIDFNGEIILVGNNIFNIEPELIKDKIVIIEGNILEDKMVNEAIEKGAKGLISARNKELIYKDIGVQTEKKLNIRAQTGEAQEGIDFSGKNKILIGYMPYQSYAKITDYIKENNIEGGDKYKGTIKNVHIRITLDFPIIQTSNILGKIDGKTTNGEILLITANLDGSGEGLDGKYFPGAVSRTSGIASLMEVARVLATQDSTPYETIIFSGWNANLQSYAGSRYYIDNPLYPLERTTVIHLQSLGMFSKEGLKLSTDNIYSKLLRQSFEKYAEDINVTTFSEKLFDIKIENNLHDITLDDFLSRKINAITLNDDLRILNNYEDTIDNIDSQTLENSMSVLFAYIKREIYRDNHMDYLGTTGKVILLIILFGLILNFLISTIYKKTPYIKFGKTTAEKIYFSIPSTLIRKFYTYIFPFFIAIILLVLIANLDPGTNIKEVAGNTQSNFSFYLLLKSVAIFIKNALRLDFGAISQTEGIWETIFTATKSSLKLIGSALLLSTILGIIRGVYEGYRARLASFRTFISLIIFSVPDVLLVLAGLLGCIALTNNYPDLAQTLKLKEFIMPLLTLSLIPTIYISRITFITVQDELKKDYIKNARAKGYSKFKIFTYELFPAILFKIIDTLPSIMTMLLSNMIIVVYLFNYTGIISYLLVFYANGNPDGLAVMAGILGIIYVLFTWGIRAIARIVNPLKREVKA